MTIRNDRRFRQVLLDAPAKHAPALAAEHRLDPATLEAALDGYMFWFLDACLPEDDGPARPPPEAGK